MSGAHRQTHHRSVLLGLASLCATGTLLASCAISGGAASATSSAGSTGTSAGSSSLSSLSSAAGTTASSGAATTAVNPAANATPGTVAAGLAIYSSTCMVCHGAKLDGNGGAFPPLKGPATVPDFPSTAVLFDYIHRSMPYSHPGILSDQEVYDLVAYLLNQNGLLQDNGVINAQTMAAVTLPGAQKVARPLPGAPTAQPTVVPGSSEASPIVGP